MAKSDVLARVAVDVAQGRTDPAIRRLGSLVAAHPTDLDLRRRLAAVYRLVGNAVEAGRWSYLSADAAPDETAAFERAYPSAGLRLRRLRWPERQGHPATEFARTRLTELATAAQATVEAGRAGQAHSSGGRGTRVVTPALTVLAGFAVAGLAVLGAVTLIQWLIG